MRNAMIAGALAVLIVGGMIFGGLFWTRHSHLELTGQVLKVRTYQVDPENTIAIIDFRATNPSTTQFQVKDVEVYLDGKDGKTLDSALFSDIDAGRVFEFYKVLGRKYNPTLLMRDKVDAGKTLDRMIAVRFSCPEQQIADRKDIRIEITEIDGNKSIITEKAR